ncbi:unnamed protein product [Rotaria sordida]|uniref:TIR domain-containing protein n=1 Tax=Rotaria sordida TaxID=392033 RepID=A0A813Z6A2_9BILA|nr:unnamed protein product [Rotaria sordida]CAF0895309.1 unnamed protein product [Rotaria sordida]
MNTLANQHCIIIREQVTTISIEQLKASLDAFVSEIKKSDSSTMNITLIKQIVSSLTYFSSKNKQLAGSEFITHPLFIILRDSVVVDYLRQRQNKDISYELLSDLSALFANISRHINNTNTHLFKQLLFHQPLIDELTNCLNEIGINGKYLDDFLLLNSIHFLLMAYQYFNRLQSIANEYSSMTSMCLAVIKCLCSSYSIEMIKKLENNFSQKLNHDHILLLSTCPLYLKWYSTNRDLNLFLQIPRILLSPFTQWMINCPSDSIIYCSKNFGNILRHLHNVLVRPIEWENDNISNEEFYNDYCKLVSHWSSFLSSALNYTSDDSDIISIKRFIVQHLYDFTLQPNILNFMKTIPNLIPMLLQMTDVQQDETQLNTYRCLGKLMSEADIKTMASPSKITGVYVKFLTNTIDDPKKQGRFYSILLSLKNFVQHDQVKIELIKQNALPLLIRCIIEIEFDSIKIKPIVLEILLALSFNNDASSILRQNTNFMTTIRNLVNNIHSNKSNLQRAAETLLWKLDKEIEAITKLTNSKLHKYDIMISYSHSDRQLCYQIHERLVQDGFSVWIDRDNMHGATMIAMAEAIENSEFVLICMSDTYKQSVYCQSEAHYAFERRCHLIPLIMKPCYKPDGWLGIMVSGKIYVDFVKLEFSLAYEKLKKEINQYRQLNMNYSMVKSKENNHQDISSIISKPVEETSILSGRPSIIELPHCITQWTNNHVQSFFRTNGLDNTMFLLCSQLDGHRLLELYDICMINRESMYQSLKGELADVHHRSLPISDYLTFLHEIKPYLPLMHTTSQSVSSSLPSSRVCKLM